MFNIIFDRDLHPYATEARWYRFKMPGMMGVGMPRIEGDFPVLELVHNDQLPTETVKGPLMVVANDNLLAVDIANFVVFEIRFLPDLTDLKDPTFAFNYAFPPSINGADINVSCIDGNVHSTLNCWQSPFVGDTWYLYIYGVTVNRDFDPGEF